MFITNGTIDIAIDTINKRKSDVAHMDSDIKKELCRNVSEKVCRLKGAAVSRSVIEQLSDIIYNKTFE